MGGYKLKTPKQAEAAAGAYKKIEETVVGAYKRVEEAVVGGYREIEGRFVDAFLEKTENDSQDGGAPPAQRE